jgi:hypothetical protein
MADEFDDGRTYFDLEIHAESREIDIWLGDDAGHLVQKAVGVLNCSLIPGDYVVEFSLGTTCYPIQLQGNIRITQSEIEAGPSCERPKVRLIDE